MDDALQPYNVYRTPKLPPITKRRYLTTSHTLNFRKFPSQQGPVEQRILIRYSHTNKLSTRRTSPPLEPIQP